MNNLWVWRRREECLKTREKRMKNTFPLRMIVNCYKNSPYSLTDKRQQLGTKDWGSRFKSLRLIIMTRSVLLYIFTELHIVFRKKLNMIEKYLCRTFIELMARKIVITSCCSILDVNIAILVILTLINLLTRP